MLVVLQATSSYARPQRFQLRANQVAKVGQLGLQKAHPGHYILTIVITDPQADKQSRTIIRNVDFMLTE